MKKIVLCNGDSIGMPRPKVDFVDTWFYKLSKAKTDYIFVNNFKRALTSNHLKSLDFLENYSPNIIILQVGIVDCAPRYFKSSSPFPKIINRFPKLISKNLWKIIKLFVRREFKKADVNIKDFEKNLNSYCDRCLSIDVEKLVIIKIQKPGDNMVIKNHQILYSIKKYNTIIDSMIEKYNFITLIDPLSDGANDDYIHDGYHLNKNGFDKVYNELKNLF